MIEPGRVPAARLFGAMSGASIASAGASAGSRVLDDDRAHRACGDRERHG